MKCACLLCLLACLPLATLAGEEEKKPNRA